jgi:hypothetical protein
MTRLVYNEAELLAEHRYAQPQVEAGHRLHGGFDADHQYISPRTLNRWPAVRAWQAELERRGQPLIDATTLLLKRGNYPSFAQQKLLLEWGYGQTLWNSLTVTGVIEARGRRLVESVVPDFQSLIDDDITGTATGHLGKGLLKAHGYDEGGRPELGEGGHDVMWFAVRDVLFGKDAYPLPEVPESLARKEAERRLPMLPLEHEQTMLMLMNVLMIEVRAEAFFSFCTDVMREPSLFADRRPEAVHAAVVVERIRQDEAIHVAYLQTAISEMRGFTFRTVDGERVSGRSFIDPVWNGLVQWHAITTPDQDMARSREHIVERVRKGPHGGRRVAAFLALEQKQAA